MTVGELAQVLLALGCPEDRCGEMASQLDKRADQLAAAKGKTREEALVHLLGLMGQGWAAREKGAGPAVGTEIS